MQNKMADINACTARTLACKTGISTPLANKIVKFRKREAKINSFNELKAIKKLTKQDMQKLKSNCVINKATPRKSSAAKKRQGEMVSKMSRSKGYKADMKLQSSPVVHVCKVQVPGDQRSTLCDQSVCKQFVPTSAFQSPSGNKLTMVYQTINAANSPAITPYAKGFPDAFSTIANPSVSAPVVDPVFETSAMPSSKVRSIQHWLSTVPLRHVRHMLPTPGPSHSGGAKSRKADDSAENEMDALISSGKTNKSKESPHKYVSDKTKAIDNNRCSPEKNIKAKQTSPCLSSTRSRSERKRKTIKSTKYSKSASNKKSRNKRNGSVSFQKSSSEYLEHMPILESSPLGEISGDANPLTLDDLDVGPHDVQRSPQPEVQVNSVLPPKDDYVNYKYERLKTSSPDGRSRHVKTRRHSVERHTRHGQPEDEHALNDFRLSRRRRDKHRSHGHHRRHYSPRRDVWPQENSCTIL